MEPIRILHFANGLHINGGLEKYLINLYKNINRKHIQFDFVCLEDNIDDYYLNQIEGLGGKVYKIPNQNEKLLTNLLYKIKLFKKYKKYGVVHIHVTSGIKAIDGLLARIFGIKHIIFHSHSFMGKIPIKYRLTKYIFRLVGTYFLACSLEAGEFFFGKAVKNKNNFMIAKNGISINDFSYNFSSRKKIREELNINDKKVIGFVGRLSMEKNLLFLIEIFNEVKKVLNDVVLLLVGDGPQKPFIIKKIYELNLNDYVIFTGVRDDIPDLMSAMDVFVLPSKFEGLGIVLIESQAAGLKTYASDNVPKESNITPLINYLNIEASPKKWAEIIINNGFNYNREKNYRNMIIEKGYDLKSASDKMEKLYLQFVELR